MRCIMGFFSIGVAFVWRYQAERFPTEEWSDIKQVFFGQHHLTVARYFCLLQGLWCRSSSWLKFSKSNNAYQIFSVFDAKKFLNKFYENVDHEIDNLGRASSVDHKIGNLRTTSIGKIGTKLCSPSYTKRSYINYRRNYNRNECLCNNQMEWSTGLALRSG